VRDHEVEAADTAARQARELGITVSFDLRSVTTG
jgi:ribosomal protein L13E